MWHPTSVARCSDIRLFPLQLFDPAAWTWCLGFSTSLEPSYFQQPHGFLFSHTPCFTAANWERQGGLGTVAVCPSPMVGSVGIMTSATLDVLGPPSGVCLPLSVPRGAGDRPPLFHWLHEGLGFLCYLWKRIGCLELYRWRSRRDLVWSLTSMGRCEQLETFVVCVWHGCFLGVQL